MMRKEQIQMLMAFGLTSLQAKTYLALAKLGKADVKTIAKASKVARQDIYRIMPTLQKIGLGEKIISTPTMYKATPIREGLSILLQNREKEYGELQKKTISLINSFQEKNAKVVLQEDRVQFTITSEITLFRRKFEKCIQNTQTKIDFIIDPEVSKTMAFHHFESLKRAMEKGVKIRLITEITREKESTRDIDSLKRKPLFTCKYLPTSVPITMGLFDGNEVNIRISNDLVPSFWTNNSVLTGLASNYFEELWNKAKIKKVKAEGLE
jgi:sugar-specific transcriptional regulator TrmB